MLVHEMLIFMAWSLILVCSSIAVTMVHFRSRTKHDYSYLNLKSILVFILIVLVGHQNYFLPTMSSREMFFWRLLQGEFHHDMIGVFLVLGVDLLIYSAYCVYLSKKTNLPMGLFGTLALWVFTYHAIFTLIFMVQMLIHWF
ncbi:MAG: hypothetical protein OXG24_04770 [Gammaproteobacteria bacterium]|nr:hypothetical protein [Gammaproteobacteria bacterium]